MSEGERRVPHCVRCGTSLLEAVTPDDISVGGRQMRFRRKTDFVVCPRCMALYRAADLHEGKVVPLTDEDLASGGETVPEP